MSSKELENRLKKFQEIHEKYDERRALERQQFILTQLEKERAAVKIDPVIRPKVEKTKQQIHNEKIIKKWEKRLDKKIIKKWESSLDK